MIDMTLDRAAQALGLQAGDGGSFRGVSTDSRALRPGMLFAALRGERADGHDFVPQALASGAAALLVERPVDAPVPQLLVPDVLRALGALAAAWRAELDPVVVAITGSNGKTTTKEMVAAILRQDASVLATEGNYNNELGLPLTLFGLEPRHRFAVLEMGASKAGDIRYLAGIAEPDVGIVTNAGPAHLQGFGDEEGVARAKGELFGSLPAEGFAVINADEEWFGLWKKLAENARTLTFGLAETADVRASVEAGHIRMITPRGGFDLQLQLPGEHNVMNALAATAAALALDIPLDQVRSGLQATRAVPGRLNLIHTDQGWTVIDDTYNANPASLYAALQVLTSEDGEPWLVLGDMKELGPASRKLHAEMGEAAASLGVRRLFAIGQASGVTVDAFGRGGRHFDTHADLLEALRRELHPGVVCLVKGSRSMAMEQVVAFLTGAGRLREAG